MRRNAPTAGIVAVILTLVASGCSSSRELSTESPAGSESGASSATDSTTGDTSATTAVEDDESTTTTAPSESTVVATLATVAPETTVPATTGPPAIPTTTTTPPSFGTPDAPIVVVTGLGVLGWWDGSAWIDSDAADPDIPVAPGVDFTTFTLGPDVGHATSTGIDIGCEPAGAYTVLLDPPTFYDPDPSNFAVNATWNLFPRPVEQLDTSNPEYIDVVREQLIADGLPSPTVQLDQLIRTDLDGDGTDEVVVAARHPDLDTGLSSRAGWFSIVLVRQVVGGDVRTTVLAEDIHVTDDAPDQLPATAQFGIDTVADFNGDGRAELAVWGQYWEGASETIYDVAAGSTPAIALEAGCGS